MRRAALVAAMLLAAVGAAGCRPQTDPMMEAAAVEQVGSNRLSGTGFTVVVPEGMSLVRQDRVDEGVETWSVMQGDVALAGIYVTNVETFPTVSLPGPLSSEDANPRTMSGPGADGVERPIEFLWRTGCESPLYIHAFAIGDDTAVRDESAAIAASVRPDVC